MPSIDQPVTVTVDDSEVAAGLAVVANATLAVVSDSSGDGAFLSSGSVDDAGTIEANSTGSDPTVTFTGPVTIETTGEIEAVGGAASVVFSGDSIDNLGIIAARSGGTVQLVNADVQGGTIETDNLTSSSGGMFEIVATSGANISVLDGSTNGTLMLDGYVQVDDGANLAFIGGIDNTGTIVVGEVTGADLVIDGTVTLDGTGAVILEGTASVITGAANVADTLVNAENIISGTGTIENFVIENQSGGAIEAVSGETLISTATQQVMLGQWRRTAAPRR